VSAEWEREMKHGRFVEALEPRRLLAGTISGVVFDDLNGNGRRDAGDPGLANQVVYLDLDLSGALNAGDVSQLTDSGGGYAIDVPDTNIRVIRVRHQIAQARRLTAPANVFYDISVGGLISSSPKNFGSTNTAIIRGNIFRDLNGNGQKNSGETGLEGWVVFLDKNNNGIKDATESYRVTNAAGDYRFAGLKAANYILRVEQQAGFVRTNPLNGMFKIFAKAGTSYSNRNFAQK
jgi:hypothetical protein